MQLDHYSDPEKARTITVEKEVEKEVETIVEKPVNVKIERKLKDNEVIVQLNPIQLLALSKPVEHPDFIEVSNQEIKLAIKETSFWTGDLKYPGFLQSMILKRTKNTTWPCSWQIISWPQSLMKPCLN